MISIPLLWGFVLSDEDLRRNWRDLKVPVGEALVGVADLEHGGLVERLADELHRQRERGAAETARQRHRGQAREVPLSGEAWGGELLLRAHLRAERGRADRGGRDEHVDGLEELLHLRAEERAEAPGLHGGGPAEKCSAREHFRRVLAVDAVLR